MSSPSRIVEFISISTALVNAGGIASYSLFCVPVLQSQPASRSLPSTRWLFSRGSHIFPQAAILAASGFAYLAYGALPSNVNLRDLASVGGQAWAFAGAALLSFSIAPFTSILMIPTNFRLIELNNRKGGARSEKSAKERPNPETGRSAEASTSGKGEASSQFTDLSKPQEKTSEATSSAKDKEVRELLAKFARLNTTRAILLGAGGLLGLWTALHH